MTDLPQDRRLIQSRQCACGCAWFVRFEYRGPNVTGYCETCGAQAHSWIPKHLILGVAKTARRAPIGDVKRNEILARYRHRCAWCGAPARDTLLEVGHIIPHNFMQHDFPGVADHPVNLAPSCRPCNEVAHKIRRESWDVSLLLIAAVKYMAELSEGKSTNERLGEDGDDNAGPVRASLREAGLARLPLQGGGKAPVDRPRLSFGDDG